MKNPFPKSEKSFFGLTFLFYLTIFIGAYPDVVFGGASFAKRDIFRFYYPVWNFAVGMMKHGVFPLWNPYSSYGAPFFADIQTCVLYPFSVLLYLPDFRFAFNFYILFHLALAGFFCCVWMRDCGASRPASFLSGLAYALGGFVMSAISLTISLTTLVYFPLVLCTVRHSFNSKGFFWKALAAIVLLVQYLGGDPAVFFATIMAVVFFTGYKTLQESLRSRRLSFKYVLDLAVILAVFLGLSAFHSLLFYEFLKHSNRFDPKFDVVTMWSMQYNDLISLFFPYFSDISLVFMNYWVRQSWLENSYAGITVFFLVAFALPQVRKKPLIGYHILLTLFGLALSLGRFCEIYRLLYYTFPFFKYIRYPARFLFLSSFAIACLAGFGLDALLDRHKTRALSLQTGRKAQFFTFLTLLFTLLVVATMAFAPHILAESFNYAQRVCADWIRQSSNPGDILDLVNSILINTKRTAVLIGFILVGVLMATYFRPKRTLLASYFILLVFADLATTNFLETRLEGRLMDEPGENLTRVLMDPGVFRILASPRSVQLQYEPPMTPKLEDTFMALKETLAPSFLLPYHVADVSGYDSLFLNEAININFERAKIKKPEEYRFYDMLNIKYMVSPSEKVGSPYRLIHPVFPTNLYVNERVLPRAYLVPEAQTLKDPLKVLSTLSSKDYAPEKTIYLEEEPSAETPMAARQGVPSKDRVTMTEYSPNQVRMKVDSAASQWLFFSDTYYPGWKAFLDKKPVKIYRANYAFRAVRVGAGSHELEWNYDPILFRIGCILSALTALALAVYFAKRIGGEKA